MSINSETAMCAAAAKPPRLELNPRAINAPLSVLFYDQGPSVHACSDRVTVTHGMARSIRASRWHTACHGRSARHGDTRRVTVDPRVTAFLSRTAQTAVLDPRVRFRSDSDSDSDPRPQGARRPPTPPTAWGRRGSRDEGPGGDPSSLVKIRVKIRI